MTPIADFVQTTSQELTPSNLRLPPLLWSTISAINKAHRLWRWYRKANVYSNPNNFAHLIAGHTMNFFLGDSLMLKIAAQCLLIATRLLDCAQQQVVVHQEGKKLLDEIRGRYPTFVDVPWPKHREGRWLSPSTVYYWKYAMANVRERVQRIALSAMAFCRSAFTLTMCLMDTIDAFYLSPTNPHDGYGEGINEGFVNLMKWIDTAVDNKESLLQGLSQNQALIEKILSGSPLSYSHLYAAVEKALEKTETIHRHVKKVSSMANGALIDMGKKAINTGMVVAGLGNFRPASLAR